MQPGGRIGPADLITSETNGNANWIELGSNNEKIALFIDGANLYATAKSLGFDIDYKRLLREFHTARLSDAGVLLHRGDRGSGVFLDPTFDRLARLQRLHRRHQGDQGIRRPDRPPQGQRQHGHRACGRRHGARRAYRSHGAVLRRRRFPLAGRGHAAARRAGDGGVDDLDPAADGRRRIAPAGRRFPRHRRTAAEDRARPRRARAARAARAPRAARAHTPQFLQRSAAPQRAGAGAHDDDFED